MNTFNLSVLHSSVINEYKMLPSHIVLSQSSWGSKQSKNVLGLTLSKASTGSSDVLDFFKKLISSGRHIPEIEQRIHLGLSSNGGGILPELAINLKLSRRSFVWLIRELSKGTETLRFDLTK